MKNNLQKVNCYIFILTFMAHLWSRKPPHVCNVNRVNEVNNYNSLNLYRLFDEPENKVVCQQQ